MAPDTPTDETMRDESPTSGETVFHQADLPVEGSDQRIAELLDASAPPEELARALETSDPADAADTLESMEPSSSLSVIQEMSDEAAADALAHMELPLAATVLPDLKPDEAARLLDHMDPDDAADLLQTLPRELVNPILTHMPRKRAAVLGKLVLYDPETAGGLMTTDFLKLRSSSTAGDALEYLRKRKDFFDDSDIYSIYCIDDGGRLEGVLDLRRLLVSKPERPIADIMDRDVEVLKPNLDREDVALAFDRYDYFVLPVIDEENRVLGVVTIDDVIDIIRAENTEDALKQVGAAPEERVYTTLRDKIRGRLPWLVINLGTASIAAAVVLFFSDLVEQIEFLAVLMPVIANQAGNAGNQSLAVTLRGLVLGQVRPDQIWSLLGREALFGLVTGVITGVLLALMTVVVVSLGLSDVNVRISIVAGVSMAGALAAGCFMGAAIPILMQKLKFDPAASSTIFLLMFTDMIAFAAFLGLASLLQGWLIQG